MNVIEAPPPLRAANIGYVIPHFSLGCLHVNTPLKNKKVYNFGCPTFKWHQHPLCTARPTYSAPVEPYCTWMDLVVDLGYAPCGVMLQTVAPLPHPHGHVLVGMPEGEQAVEHVPGDGTTSKAAGGIARNSVGNMRVRYGSRRTFVSFHYEDIVVALKIYQLMKKSKKANNASTPQKLQWEKKGCVNGP